MGAAAAPCLCHLSPQHDRLLLRPINAAAAAVAAGRRLNAVRLSLVPHNFPPTKESLKNYRRLYATCDDDDNDGVTTTIISSSAGKDRDAPFSAPPQHRTRQMLRENFLRSAWMRRAWEKQCSSSPWRMPVPATTTVAMVVQPFGRAGRFTIPKRQSCFLDSVQLNAAAVRTARQVEFLWKRQAAPIAPARMGAPPFETTTTRARS